MMEDLVKSVLCEEYGLKMGWATEVRGGWSAAAFVVGCDRGEFFVKVYDGMRPSVQPWIERMDLCAPVVSWLYDNTPLRESMVAPVLTFGGSYRVERGGYVFMLFPFVEGQALGEARLDGRQICELGDVLSLLHSYGEGIPVSTDGIREDYSVSFLEGFEDVLCEGKMLSVLCGVLQPYAGGLLEEAGRLRSLAEGLRGSSLRCSLCHTDVHGWNLMWDGRLVLIDWEGLRLAPVEADLFVFTEGFFFDYGRDCFFEEYGKARGGYVWDEDAMEFYRLRRRLEDIWEFVCSVSDDGLSRLEIERALFYVKRECEALLGGV